MLLICILFENKNKIYLFIFSFRLNERKLQQHEVRYRSLRRRLHAEKVTQDECEYGRRRRVLAALLLLAVTILIVIALLLFHI